MKNNVLIYRGPLVQKIDEWLKKVVNTPCLENHVVRDTLQAVIGIIYDEKPVDKPDSRNGKWKQGDVVRGYFTPGGNRPWICSECGHLESWTIYEPDANYCPKCGVEMIKEMR